MVSTDRSIVLMGMMGSGKSTLGIRLATALNRTYTDLDTLIEGLAGQSITEIFNNQGEEVFRIFESEALTMAIDQPKRVISLGGGTPCFGSNLELILKKSFSVYLKCSQEELFRRLASSKTVRPLTAGKSNDELKTLITGLLKLREPYYMQANLIAESDRLSLTQLLKLLETHKS